MMPILQIGPLAIQLPGLLLILGIYLGLWLAERYSSRYKVAPNTLYSLVLLTLITGFIGARLSYVLRYPEIFTSNPGSLFSLNYTLLDQFGGISVAMLGALVYGQKKGLSFWSTLDALTPLLAAFAITLALAHIASGSAFGAVTKKPWGIELWGAKRHPSQIYEAVTASLILVILWPARQWIKRLVSGGYFLSFCALTSLSVLFLEAFRGDSILLPGGFRLPQVLAMLILLLSLYGLKKSAVYPVEEKVSFTSS